MTTTKTMTREVAEWFAKLDQPERAALEQLRSTILEAAPEADEVISYGVPSYRMRVGLVSYGAAKDHLTFFVQSTAVLDAHAGELGGFKLGKGSVQFSPDHPIPANIVKKLVKARIAETAAPKPRKG